MTELDPLNDELDQWNFEGEEATLWWRDDDAQQDTPALAKVVELSKRFDIPLSLAVIPDGIESSLIEAIGDNALVSVLLHGFSHTNYAGINEKKQELGAHRDITDICSQLDLGIKILQQAFGQQFVPVLVPPWDRIAPEVVDALPQRGLMGLSTYCARELPEPVEGVWQINTHADIINWKQERTFLGQKQVVDQLVDHLCGRRLGKYDRAEPTGLLTHHLVHDEPGWMFLEALFATLDEHPAVTWLSAERVFQTRWR